MKEFFMSKSKEQCLNIISQHFIEASDSLNIKSKVLALEKSIKEISGSEHSLIWTYDNETNILKTTNVKVPLSDSILKSVLISKKVFFDNHLQSHKKYDRDLDNPLKIDIKSILIAPVLDQTKENVIGFISAFNSMKNGHEFQRYDTRSIALLDKHSRETIELLLKNNFNINEEKKLVTNSQKVKEKEKKVIVPKIIKTKNNLEDDLKKQVEKLIDLENLLKLKDEEIKELKDDAENNTILSEKHIDVIAPVTNVHKLENILSFLTNEVTYLSNDSHAIYSFLEVIKNSLYDRKQLAFIDEELKNSQLINNFSDSLYNQDRMPIINREFHSFESFCSITNLYSKAFSQENITFNVFIDPRLPNKMVSDIEKIKSVMVHLINNVKGLISTNGIAEVIISYIEEATIEIIVKGIQPEAEKKISNFFKSNVTSNSLTCNSSGLGLSVSSNLINILGAKLRLTTEGKNEHSFTALIPIDMVNIIESQKKFKNKEPLKIGILFNEENKYAYMNLRRYLEAFSVDKSNIAIFNSYKKMSNLKVSHFICFENMLSDKIDMKKFPSITILKHSDSLLPNNYKNNVKVNELYINSYYGMVLQKILFPDVLAEDLTGNMILIEDTFLTKVASKFKR
jgi:signal transduction histidine kinase